MTAVENLKQYLEDEIVLSSWGDYLGISDLTLVKLGALKVLVDAAIEAELRGPLLSETDNT